MSVCTEVGMCTCAHAAAKRGHWILQDGVRDICRKLALKSELWSS